MSVPNRKIGRPPKYTAEEKQDKYKEQKKKYYNEHYKAKLEEARQQALCPNCKQACPNCIPTKINIEIVEPTDKQII